MLQSSRSKIMKKLTATACSKTYGQEIKKVKKFCQKSVQQQRKMFCYLEVMKEKLRE